MLAVITGLLQLKITPKVGLRYWVAILIASMCGTNIGDFVPDILKFSAGAGLLILVLLFSAIVAADRMTRYGGEVFYWLAILVVRAAATNIADFSIGSAHLGYGTVAAVLAALLVGLVELQRKSGPKSSKGNLPPTDGLYWLTMLTAGSLGAVIGDGIGHAFGRVQIGVPISAGIAAIALVLILGVRARLASASHASYWVAVVAVRWFGTNIGDIGAFFLSLSISMVATGLALALTVLLWRAPVTGHRDDARSLEV